MRDQVPGEQYAQVDNADPFTAPVWRSPVHRTPEWVIWLVQLVRLLIRVIWFLIRHPLLDAAAGIVVTDLGEGRLAGRRGPGQRHRRGAGDAAAGPAGLVRPARHRPGQVAVAVVVLPAPLAARHDHRRARPHVPGPGDPAGAGQGPGRAVRGPGDRPPGVGAVAEAVRRPGRASWRTGSGCCRAGSAPPHPGWRSWNWSAGTPWRRSSRPCPSRLPRICGRCRSAGARTAAAFTIRLHGTHLLIAGATGAGKGSYIWGLVRAMLPAMLAGLAVVHACDPKLMELAFGRPLFERHGTYAADPGRHRRPARGRRRRHAKPGRPVRRTPARPHPDGGVPVRGGAGR